MVYDIISSLDNHVLIIFLPQCLSYHRLTLILKLTHLYPSICIRLSTLLSTRKDPPTGKLNLPRADTGS